MKTSRLAIVFFCVLAILSILACGFGDTAKNIADKNTALYDEGIKMTRSYQTKVADCYLTVNNLKGKIADIESTGTEYGALVNANTAAWTGNIQPAKDALDTQMAPYAAAMSADGTTIDPNKINLDELQKNNAFPTDLAGGLSFYMNAVTQAPPPEVKVSIFEKIIDIKSEAWDTMTYACKPVNEAANAYNTWIASVEGEIVDKVSSTVGFPLPKQLPLYVGGSSDVAPTPFE